MTADVAHRDTADRGAKSDRAGLAKAGDAAEHATAAQASARHDATKQASAEQDLGSLPLASLLGQIHPGDCVAGMQRLPAESIDLVFADPPFNIGYSYDVYDDRLGSQPYLDWSSQWMAQVHRVLHHSGSFWLAIGDEYAAELKVRATELGFICRSWVIWYYTFGVHCQHKFTRSHAHLFHFVKDAKQFKFFPEAVRVPSARQLVYRDARAAAGGRMPDDTWVLRPQDLVDGFTANEDCWYFPRVAGTFKERAGFHGCQMPEQLLGRIIRSCSESDDVVMDPFSGSSTTVAVAKKLGRRWLSFELSEEYVRLGTARLESIQPGDALDGSPEPTVSAPPTVRGKRRRGDAAAAKSANRSAGSTTNAGATIRLPQVDPAFGFDRQGQPTLFDLELTDDDESRLLETFIDHSRGCTPDRVIADPVMQAELQRKWDLAGLPGTAAERNRLLFALRAAGRLAAAGFQPDERTWFSWQEQQPYRFASEIAWARLAAEYPQRTLDELLCHPDTAAQFDLWAQRYRPGYRPLEYRWAALTLRRRLRNGRDTLLAAAPLTDTPLTDTLAGTQTDPQTDAPAASAPAPNATTDRWANLPPLGQPRLVLEPATAAEQLSVACLSAGQAGLLAVGIEPSESGEQFLYIGETADLATALRSMWGDDDQRAWWFAATAGRPLQLWWHACDQVLAHPLQQQLAWVSRYRPRWNCSEFVLPVPPAAASGKAAGGHPESDQHD